VTMIVSVAAFDVDNTLTVRDCVVPFMRSVAGVGRLFRVMLSDLGKNANNNPLLYLGGGGRQAG
jgi:hypothetical protein